MKKLIIWLLCMSLLVLSGCSDLWETVECVAGDWSKRTEMVVWETNRRVLIKRGNGFYLLESERRDRRNNCTTIKEELPPNMLSWYEHLSWTFTAY